jgi:hypothetical protein
MLAGLKAWFVALSTIGKVGVVSAAVIAGGATDAAIAGQNPQPAPQPAPQASCKSVDSTATETQPIQFEKTSVDDPATAKGKSYIKVAGVNGVKTITYSIVTYSPAGCQPDTKTAQKEEITTPAIAEVTAVGTYVAPAQPTCSNGSYTNVDGSTVCSPTTTDNGGATARCVDGTYSYSLHRSGTCSHHGGVAIWY